MGSEIRTQLGGKYSSQDETIFKIKKTLTGIGVDVTYPKGNGILSKELVFALTATEELNVPFDKIELGFLKAIQNSNLHIIYNCFQNEQGYLGESAGIELAYALAIGKPVLLTYSPVFSSTFPENLQQIILNNLEYLYIEDFLKFKKTEIETMLKKVLQLNNHGEYVISDKDKTIIMRRIKRLLVNKRQEYESVVKKTK